jgi:CDP-glycerol glycerophosphotransferase (TagB/SpsB family)
MRAECDGLVVTNLQSWVAMRFLLGARRLGLPVAGYVASWDHTVGKGVVSPHLSRYIVQNDTMREDLVQYHGIDPGRVVVTGWPQTDVFHQRRSRRRYEELLARLGVDPSKPVVLFAGNTPTNAPYEGNLVTRLVDWLRGGAHERLSILFRPHPRESKPHPERYAAVTGETGAVLQERSYTDLDDLATLLQHVDCLVSTAGTILLDALVNDRPSVCVLFDEGAPPGERWAGLNLVGEHYRRLAESAAFLRAYEFDELIRDIERCIEHPSELAEERARVARAVVGEVDGRAGQRVVEAIVQTFERPVAAVG